MAERRSKITELSEAISQIHSGQTVAFGGCFTHNKPMAAVREIARQGQRDLRFVAAPAASLDADLLIGVQALKQVVTSYVGFEHLGLAPHFRRSLERGTLLHWECDEAHLMVALEAAARLAPSGLTLAGLGTDLVRLNPDLRVIPDPFTGQPVVAVQAIKIDVAVLHTQSTDQFGNSMHKGSLFGDLLLAQAVKRQGGKVILTTDQVVDSSHLENGLRRVTLPHILVDQVVEVPRGAHPCSSHGMYQADEAHLKRYLEAARTPEGWLGYLQQFVYDAASSADYLTAIGGQDRFSMLEREAHE